MDDGWLYVQHSTTTLRSTGGDSHKRSVQVMTPSESRYMIFQVGRPFHSQRLGWSTLKEAVEAADKMSSRVVGIYDKRRNVWHDYAPQKGEAT